MNQANIEKTQDTYYTAKSVQTFTLVFVTYYYYIRKTISIFKDRCPCFTGRVYFLRTNKHDQVFYLLRFNLNPKMGPD